MPRRRQNGRHSIPTPQGRLAQPAKPVTYIPRLLRRKWAETRPTVRMASGEVNAKPEKEPKFF